MGDLESFKAFVYWPHVILGISSAFAVLAAIFSAKGGTLHKTAGLTFSITMSVAAVTALMFSLWNFAPAAIFSGLSVIYGIGMATLSLRERSSGWRAFQWALLVLPLGLGLFGIVAFASLFIQDLPTSLRLMAGIPASMVTIFFLSLAWRDFRFMRASQIDRTRRLHRHALRMAIAAAEVVRAPLLSFGVPIGLDGSGAFLLYFFGPFLLIPLIYFFAMPAWVKRREAATLGRPLPA